MTSPRDMGTKYGMGVGWDGAGWEMGDGNGGIYPVFPPTLPGDAIDGLAR